MKRSAVHSTLLVALLSFPAAGLQAGKIVIRKASKAALELAEEPIPAITVRAPSYSADVYPDGRIRLYTGKVTLFRNLRLDLEGKPFTLTDLRQLGPNTIALCEGLPLKEKKFLGDEPEPDDDGLALTVPIPVQEAPNLPSIVLKFSEDGFEVGFTGLKVYRATQPESLPAAFNCQGSFGDDAVGVRNLRTGFVDALPSQYICWRHVFSPGGWYGPYWPDVEATYSNGLRVEIRGATGISHGKIDQITPKPTDPESPDPGRFNPAQALRGFWALNALSKDSRISFTIHPAEKPFTVAPAPYYTVSCEKPKNFFQEDEPVLFNLQFAEQHLVPGKWQIAWTLEDHRQRPVSEGRREVTLEKGQPPQLVVDLAPKHMGFLRARIQMSQANGASSAVRTHEVNFARVRLEPAAKPFLPKTSGEGGEMEWSNVLGLRGARLVLSLGEIRARHQTPEGNVDWEGWAADFGNFMKTARTGTLKGFFCLLELSSKDMDKEFQGLYPDPEERQIRKHEAQLRWLGEWARQANKCGLDIWEPINEPNLGMSPEGYIESILKVQYPEVKAANPQANFLGGSICGLDNYGWVRRLFELGGQKYFDGISFHPYTGLGFQEMYRAELDKWWQILRDYKAEDRGLWMTESAWHRGWSINEYIVHHFNSVRESQARNAVLMLLNAEAMAIPRERVYVFYLHEHGYNEFFLLGYRDPTSAAISLQVMNECLRDAKFVKEIPLPGRGHHFQLYQDDTRTVAVAMTDDEPVDLVLATDAPEVVVTDMMGNRKTIRPEAGNLRITMSGDPTYLAVGPKHMLLPAYKELKVQPNLALYSLGASVQASDPQPATAETQKGPLPLNPGAAICGDWTSYAGPRLFGQWWGWQEDGVGKWPDWLEVRLPKPVPVVRVRVYHEYGGWSRALRDYDLQVFVRGDWMTVAQVRGNVYRNIYDHQFEPETTDRVRILVHDVTVPQSWLSKVSSVRAIEVFSPAEGQAKAFFIQDFPRQRLLKPGESTEWRFSLQNVTGAAVAGQVRLKLPPGLTSAPGELAVSLPPSGTAECVFRFTINSEAQDGLYTAVAGLFEGDRLISSDYEPCVVASRRPPPPKAETAQQPTKEEGTKKPKEQPDKDPKEKPKRPKNELELLDEQDEKGGTGKLGDDL